MNKKIFTPKIDNKEKKEESISVFKFFKDSGYRPLTLDKDI